MRSERKSIATPLLLAFSLATAFGCNEVPGFAGASNAPGAGSGDEAGSGFDADTSTTPAAPAVPDAATAPDLEAGSDAPVVDGGQGAIPPSAEAGADVGAPRAASAAICSAPQGNDAAVQALVAGDTAFAVDLYAPTAAIVGAGQNAIVSPYSISAALTMVDVGAAGETDTQIQNVLHLPDTGANVAPAYAALACQNETDGTSPGNQLLVANSLWAQQGKTFLPSFLSVLATGYDAPLQLVDFASDPDDATTAINQWVSNATQTEIPMLFQPGDITNKTQLVLVDAVYFKGTWENGFEPGNTSPHPFSLSDGTQLSVPTMSGFVSLRGSYSKAAALTVYELPYKGNNLAMDFLLPAAGPLASLESSLTSDTLNASLASLVGPSQVQLFLPKFSFTTRLALDPVLAGLGMPDAFAIGTANLSGMDGLMDLSIGQVVHQAQVEVDEQGTVAAAATGVEVCNCSVVIEPPMVLINRPFLFLIRDTNTGSILFMGRVEDPRQGS
jgi:serpin B